MIYNQIVTWTAFAILAMFLDSSLPHLEPKLQLFEVDDHGNAGNDDHLQNWRPILIFRLKFLVTSLMTNGNAVVSIKLASICLSSQI